MLTASQLTSITYSGSYLILLLIFYVKTRKFQQSDFILILLALVLGMVQNALSFVVNYTMEDIYSVQYISYNFLLDIMFLSLMILLSLFVDRIQHLRMNRIKIIVITIFASLNVFANLIMLLIGGNSLLDRLAYLGTNLLVVVTTYFITVNFYRIYQTYQELASLLQFVASGLIFFSFSLFTILDIFQLNRLLTGKEPNSFIFQNFGYLIGFGRILVIIGFLSFILVFILNLDIIYRSLENIQDMIIFSTSGVALYGIGRNADEASLEYQLLSGFVSAMNNFVQEMKPHHVDEKLRLFESTHRSMDVWYGDKVGIAILVDKRTYILKRKLLSLIASIEDEVVKNKTKNQLYKEFNDQIMRNIMKRELPFLNIDDMETY